MLVNKQTVETVYQETLAVPLLATEQLLLCCSSSVHPSVHPKQNSGAGDTEEITGPIYLVFFICGEIILNR